MGLIEFGQIIKPHGLSGEVIILPYSRDLTNLISLKKVFIRTYSKSNHPDKEPNEFLIVELKPKTDRAIAKLEGIDTRSDAEALRGALVYIDGADISETEEDEYYWFELIGLDVFTADDTHLGKVSSLIDRTSQPLLVVTDNDKEYLIPMTDTIIKEIDLKESKITITPPDGLIEEID